MDTVTGNVPYTGGAEEGEVEYQKLKFKEFENKFMKRTLQ